MKEVPVFLFRSIIVSIALAACAPDAPTLAQRGVSSNAEWKPFIQSFEGVDMVLVPAGCFMMGSDTGGDNENPVHEQCFDEPFWIDVYEVTNGQFGATDPNENQPVRYINWLDSSDYCLSRGARLPTEAEWEYAARGPDSLVYPWRADISGPEASAYLVWLGSDKEDRGLPNSVGSAPLGISWVGALDLSGNVWEWTSSTYQPYPYDSSDGREAPGEIDGESARVTRGGSFRSEADDARSARRLPKIPTAATEFIGFRCVRDYKIDG